MAPTIHEVAYHSIVQVLHIQFYHEVGTRGLRMVNADVSQYAGNLAVMYASAKHIVIQSALDADTQQQIVDRVAGMAKQHIIDELETLDTQLNPRTQTATEWATAWFTYETLDAERRRR
jgi:hypothetical protein